jgi:hypothetical protein
VGITLCAQTTVRTLVHNACVPATIVRVTQLAELLTVLGASGTVIGGVVGWLIDAPTSRRAFENLALGATAGGVGGCLVAFFAYLGAWVVGG